jgi:hypothetical protein
VSTGTTVECGAETPNGRCTRRVGVGGHCPFHPESGRNGTADAGLSPDPCGCVDPLPVRDSHGEVRCVKCGHAPANERIEMPQGRKALEADLLRRSNEAAERRAAAEAADPDRPAWNPFADPDHQERQTAKEQRDRELIFGPEPPELEPPTRPVGSANGGEGDPGDITIDYTPSGEPFRVYDLDDLMGGGE